MSSEILFECSKCSTHFKKSSGYCGTTPLCVRCRRRIITKRRSISPKHQQRTENLPWLYSLGWIKFSFFEYPDFPGYLGTVTTSACGYQHQECKTGALVHSQCFEILDKPISIEWDGKSFTGSCQWLVDLKKSTEKRPSEKHFLIVFSGIKGYESRTIKVSSSPNPQFPAYADAWWTDRWPTHEEAIILKILHGEFSFGKPPSFHVHGN